MVERAGVDPEPANSRLPCAANGLTHQPCSMALSRHLGNQTQKADYGLPRAPPIQFDESHCFCGSQDDMDFPDLLGELKVGHGQPRIPKPMRADPGEELAVGFEIQTSLLHLQRGRDSWQPGRPIHLKICDDGGDMATRY